MEEQWERVYSSQQQYHISVLLALLESENIQAHTINKIDSAYLFGEIEIYVGRQDVMRALQLINKHPEL